MGNRVDRAKQFLPFDALKGLQEALREKEIVYEDRRELSEEMYEDLSLKFQRIDENTYIKIKFYNNRKYMNLEGKVQKLNENKKYLIINSVKVNFFDIVEIEII